MSQVAIVGFSRPNPLRSQKEEPIENLFPEEIYDELGLGMKSEYFLMENLFSELYDGFVPILGENLKINHRGDYVTILLAGRQARKLRLKKQGMKVTNKELDECPDEILEAEFHLSRLVMQLKLQKLKPPETVTNPSSTASQTKENQSQSTEQSQKDNNDTQKSQDNNNNNTQNSEEKKQEGGEDDKPKELPKIYVQPYWLKDLDTITEENVHRMVVDLHRSQYEMPSTRGVSHSARVNYSLYTRSRIQRKFLFFSLFLTNSLNNLTKNLKNYYKIRNYLATTLGKLGLFILLILLLLAEMALISYLNSDSDNIQLDAIEFHEVKFWLLMLLKSNRQTFIDRGIIDWINETLKNRPEQAQGALRKIVTLFHLAEDDEKLRISQSLNPELLFSSICNIPDMSVKLDLLSGLAEMSNDRDFSKRITEIHPNLMESIFRELSTPTNFTTSSEMQKYLLEMLVNLSSNPQGRHQLTSKDVQQRIVLLSNLYSTTFQTKVIRQQCYILLDYFAATDLKGHHVSPSTSMTLSKIVDSTLKKPWFSSEMKETLKILSSSTLVGMTWGYLQTSSASRYSLASNIILGTLLWRDTIFPPFEKVVVPPLVRQMAGIVNLSESDWKIMSRSAVFGSLALLSFFYLRLPTVACAGTCYFFWNSPSMPGGRKSNF